MVIDFSSDEKRMATKRAKKSLNHGGDLEKWDKIIRSSSPTKDDIVELFFSDILMRIPTKSIVFCKSVCKKWYNFISSPEFVQFHSKHIKPQFLVRTLDSTRISRTLHLVEPEQHSRCFDLDYSCKSKDAKTSHIELNSVMKIPLHNADRVLLGDPIVSTAKAKRTRTDLTRRNHKFNIANSCRGLLCLCENSRNDPVAVCNPVTGEFLNLPRSRSEFDYVGSIDSGIGFSPESNQYKVVRVFTLEMPGQRRNCGEYTNTFAEVHTLGTDSWRSVVGAPSSWRKLAFPTYVDGALYCLFDGYKNSDGIVSFDFDTERFETVPMPPLSKITTRHVTLGVLRGKLYVCDASDMECADIWVMNDSVGGGRKSWTRMFAIRESCGEWAYGLCQPLSYFDNGALLVFCNYTSGIIYSTREGFESEHLNYTTGTHRYLRLNGLKSRYEVLAYTPSFVPLKDIVAADHVEVLNVSSRCGGLKLPGETKPLNLKGHFIEESYFFTEVDEVEEDYWTKHFWKK